MTTFFVLVLLLTPAGGISYESKFGPYTLEECAAEGKRWLQQQVGRTDVIKATWDCRVMTWRK